MKFFVHLTLLLTALACLAISGCGSDTLVAPLSNRPVLLSVVPLYGTEYSYVKIYGRGFAQQKSRVTVTIGGTPAVVIRVTDTLIDISVGRSTHTGPVMVIVGKDTLRVYTDFQVDGTISSPVHSLTVFDPMQGYAGMRVNLFGHFPIDSLPYQVLFGTVQAGILNMDTDHITVNVPSGAVASNIEVVKGGLRRKYASVFKVQGLAITSFTPRGGYYGTLVNVSGRFPGALADYTVAFGTKKAQIIELQKDLLTVRVPDGASTSQIIVIAGKDTANTGLSFTIQRTPYPYSKCTFELSGVNVKVASRNQDNPIDTSVSDFSWTAEITRDPDTDSLSSGDTLRFSKAIIDHAPDWDAGYSLKVIIDPVWQTLMIDKIVYNTRAYHQVGSEGQTITIQTTSVYYEKHDSDIVVQVSGPAVTTFLKYLSNNRDSSSGFISQGRVFITNSSSYNILAIISARPDAYLRITLSR